MSATACGGGTGLVKQYEYEEDITLSVDGSARIELNASIPALVNLRGFDLNTHATALLDRSRIRDLFTTPATRVVRISSWRRFGRRFVQVRLAVDDITKLGSTAPFSWATYTIDRRDGLVVYRQVLGAAAGKPVPDLKLKGDELMAIRLHVPSRIRYHNAGEGNLKRGNILVWEQEFAARQIGSPLEIEARFEQTSILYSTLMLFAVSGLLAMAVLALLIWWVVRRGKPAAGQA
ncbi:MAG: hypothetical protein NTY02_07490 [Acidobacteria bacterium]|nr:hypothetical protein [Acidobacteriota bacterium]